jgi:hypothetical protein
MGAFFPTRGMPADRIAIRDWAQAAESIGFNFVEIPDPRLRGPTAPR